MQPTITLSMEFLQRYAVYGFRRGSKYMYIGKTTGLLKRFGSHHVVGPRYQPDSEDLLDVWFCSSLQEATDLEFELIQEHAPTYNIVDKFDSPQSSRRAAKLFATRTVSDSENH